MLEDELEDILRKASRGKGLSLASLTESNETLATLAKKLDLNYPALEALNDTFTEAELPNEVTMITTRFGHLGVNAFVVETPSGTYLIDTGTEPQKLNHLDPDFILITHDHPDHSAGARSFSAKTFYPGTQQAQLSPDIISYDVSGHCTPSLAYYFPQLSKPTCFVGDSIFRRSIGGCSSVQAYQTALKNVRHLLQSLPDETILCVGHGPNTTVKEEKQQNPFFA